ncbi:MAG: hypothetical protein KDA88_22230 [Planctomycetaceae bacterium]|nr:hypothetical protein [Planctomycetaceae bacterium]MCB9951642.1 hypothetical protein [Planctomycetaceae bacterium]
MPVQINIGLNKKVGEANYGSRGASVNLEVELDSGIIEDPDRLRSQIHKLFGLARDSLNAELHADDNHHAGNGHHSNGNGRTNGHGYANGSTGNRSSNGRGATQSQVRAINAIAKRNRIDLIPILRQYGVQAATDLSISDASNLIDELKGQPAGNGGRG